MQNVMVLGCRTEFRRPKRTSIEEGTISYNFNWLAEKNSNRRKFVPTEMTGRKKLIFEFPG